MGIGQVPIFLPSGPKLSSVTVEDPNTADPSSPTPPPESKTPAGFFFIQKQLDRFPS
jgi:hypothetical protein